MTEGQGTGTGTGPAPNELNTNVPQSARVYDYLLGGKDNFPADREVAEQVLAIAPRKPKR